MLKKIDMPAFAGTRAGAHNASVKMVNSGQSRTSKHIADLQWQIKFTQMKIDDWPAQDNIRWMTFARMQEYAKQELRDIAS